MGQSNMSGRGKGVDRDPVPPEAWKLDGEGKWKTRSEP
eukprot:gene51532-9058_t